MAVDIAETSVTVDAHERYKRMLTKRRRNGRPHFKADFIAADCTKIRLLDLYPRKVIVGRKSMNINGDPNTGQVWFLNGKSGFISSVFMP